MTQSLPARHPSVVQLAAFADGKLAGSERAVLQSHLNQCPNCRNALAALPSGAESSSGQNTLQPAGVMKVTASPPVLATTTHRPGNDVPADLAHHPKFEILQMLGQGGMGAVYKARHKVMDRIVALKIINAQLVSSDMAVERFRREVQAAAKLQHPSIVAAYDADQAGSTHFLVMEFVEGIDLAQHVKRKGPLPAAHACHFIRQAALGLQHAHEKGMVHRDIKPHNLMLTAQGVVKVMDFGLARLAREGTADVGLTGENVLMGTAD
jgi:eukaryotic-like serine/threonine-protein kinase